MNKNVLASTLAVLNIVVFWIINSSAFISPVIFWPSSFISLLIPLTLILQLILIPIFLVTKIHKIFKAGIITTLFAYLIFIPELVGMKYLFQAYEPYDLTITNYNVGHFGNQNCSSKTAIMDSELELEKSKKFIQEIASSQSDILCIQEFYHCEKSNSFNTLNLFLKNHPYYYLSVDTIKNNGSIYGLAIFSKHPIISSKEIFKNKNRFNRACYADIKIDYKTIRVFNVHLQSNQIKKHNPMNDKSISKMEDDAQNIFYKLKNNLTTRLSQTDSVLSVCEKTEIPLVIAGDYNETPFGYSYNKFKSKFTNSFTHAGKGFGFTFNSKSLFFLRIDHQFYSEGISCTSTFVNREMNYSDHFPVSSIYNLK